MIPKRVYTAFKRWAVISAGPLLYYDYINPLDNLYSVYKKLVESPVEIDNVEVTEESISVNKYIEPVTVTYSRQDTKIERAENLNYFSNNLINEMSAIYENSSLLYLLLTWLTILCTSLFALRYFQGKNVYNFLKSLTANDPNDDLENENPLKGIVMCLYAKNNLIISIFI